MMELARSQACCWDCCLATPKVRLLRGEKSRVCVFFHPQVLEAEPESFPCLPAVPWWARSKGSLGFTWWSSKGKEERTPSLHGEGHGRTVAKYSSPHRSQPPGLSPPAVLSPRQRSHPPLAFLLLGCSLLPLRPLTPAAG